jgi:hypothetical protein
VRIESESLFWNLSSRKSFWMNFDAQSFQKSCVLVLKVIFTLNLQEISCLYCYLLEKEEIFSSCLLRILLREVSVCLMLTSTFCFADRKKRKRSRRKRSNNNNNIILYLLDIILALSIIIILLHTMFYY